MTMKPAGRIAAALLLLPFICAAPAGADERALDQPAPPAVLRLAQVAVRLPTINVYVEAQDGDDEPVPLKNAPLTALVGSASLPLQAANDADDAAYPGTAFVFAIDVSGSMRNRMPDGNGQSKFDLARLTLAAWIKQMRPQDRATIITLGSVVTQQLDFTGDQTALLNAATHITLQSGGDTYDNTLLYQALVRAIDLEHRLDAQLPLRRAIVVMTDGVDDELGGAGRQEVADKLALDPVPIYSLAFAPPARAADESSLKDFGALARLSGGDILRVTDAARLNGSYLKLLRVERFTEHYTATCTTCTADGSPVAVRAFLEQDQRLGSQIVTVSMVGANGVVTPPAAPPLPPPAAAPAPPPVNPAPPPAVNQQPLGWAGKLTLLVNIRILGVVPLLWAVLGLIVLAGAICAALYAVLHKRPPAAVAPPAAARQEPQIGVTVAGGTMVIAAHVAVTPFTSPDRPRLRVFPLGRNNLDPFDVVFDGPITVGRDPGSDICINNDTQVSAKHCRLTPSAKRILIEDTGSRNGTRVNGVPIPGPLHAETDAILGVGRTELRLKPISGTP